MSIRYIWQKIKGIGDISSNKDIFTILLIILTSFASFGLGRLSKVEELKSPVNIENQASVIAVQGGQDEGVAQVSEEKLYVASKNSNKYHLPWCSGAQRISEKNKIWFSSKEEAEKAGYQPASNCKGI